MIIKLPFRFVRRLVGVKDGEIDFALYSPPEGEPIHPIPILLIPGWSGDRTGIRLLAWFLTILGFAVIVPSLPGYGSSFTPKSKSWSGQDGFTREATWLHQIWTKLRSRNGRLTQFYCVGHSAGCQIGAEMARLWPEEIAKLVFLSPSGLEEVSGFWPKIKFAGRFFYSAWKHDQAFNKSPLKEKWDLTHEPQPSPFWPFVRLQQRWNEFQRLCHRHLGQALFDGAFPVSGEHIMVMTGTLDTVFGDLIKRLSPQLDELGIDVASLRGGYHNLTKLKADEVAEEIKNFLLTA